MGFLLKFVIIMLVARLIVGALRYLLGGGQRRRSASPPNPVQDKRQRARRKLDEDIVEAEFEDLSEDKHKHKQG